MDGTNVVSIEWDHRIAREEWVAAVPNIRRAAQSWAAYVRLREASAGDFEKIDQNGGGYIDFREVCRRALTRDTRTGTRPPPLGLRERQCP